MAVAVQACKERKSEASSILNTVHEFEDNQLNITDISNTEGKSGTWFWNKSKNRSDSDTKKDKYSDNSDRNKNKEERNQEERESKIQ